MSYGVSEYWQYLWLDCVHTSHTSKFTLPITTELFNLEYGLLWHHESSQCIPVAFLWHTVKCLPKFQECNEDNYLVYRTLDTTVWLPRVHLKIFKVCDNGWMGRQFGHSPGLLFFLRIGIIMLSCLSNCVLPFPGWRPYWIRVLTPRSSVSSSTAMSSRPVWLHLWRKEINCLNIEWYIFYGILQVTKFRPWCNR